MQTDMTTLATQAPSGDLDIRAEAGSRPAAWGGGYRGAFSASVMLLLIAALFAFLTSRPLTLRPRIAQGT